MHGRAERNAVIENQNRLRADSRRFSVLYELPQQPAAADAGDADIPDAATKICPVRIRNENRGVIGSVSLMESLPALPFKEDAECAADTRTKKLRLHCPPRGAQSVCTGFLD